MIVSIDPFCALSLRFTSIGLGKPDRRDLSLLNIASVHQASVTIPLMLLIVGVYFSSLFLSIFFPSRTDFRISIFRRKIIKKVFGNVGHLCETEFISFVLVSTNPDDISIKIDL